METDGRAWLADYRRRLDDLRGRAERVQAEISALSATATSPDGAVRATVGHTGALRDLAFGAAADLLPRERLAALVVATTADAAAEVARRAEQALGPLLDR
ncbi:YbaB/EbfC family nucleoid-associated protein [Pseudonocardia xishanensis]